MMGMVGLAQACLSTFGSLLLLVGLCVAGLSAEEPALVDQLLASQAGHEQVQAQLVYTVREPGQPSLDERRTLLWIWAAAPDRYRIRLRQENDEAGVYEDFASDGAAHWRGERLFPDEAPIIAESDGDNPLVERVRTFFPLNREAVEAEFRLRASEAEAGPELLLMPGTAELQRRLERIVVRFTPERRLREIAVDDTDGNHWLFSVQELAYPEAIDPAIFQRQWQPAEPL